jgi:hypothetical protein
MFIAMIGTVSLEIALVSRFWTFPFFLAWSLSFALAFPFLILLPLLLQAFGTHDSSQVRKRPHDHSGKHKQSSSRI